MFDPEGKSIAPPHVSNGPPLTRGDPQETFTRIAVSTNRDVPGNRDLLKVERTQSLLRSCYHTFSKSLLEVRLEAILH